MQPIRGRPQWIMELTSGNSNSDDRELYLRRWARRARVAWEYLRNVLDSCGKSDAAPLNWGPQEAIRLGREERDVPLLSS
jgi:hypothetical protein